MELRDRIDLIQRIAQRMRIYLVNLSQEDWAKPSACDAWEVRDVLGHLVGGAERQMESFRRGLAGDSGPPEGFVPLDADALSANNARQYVALRESLGDQLLPVFTQRYEELGQALDALASRLGKTVLALEAGNYDSQRVRGPAYSGVDNPRLGHPVCL